MTRRFALLAVLFLAGCPDPKACKLPFAGDREQPMEAVLALDVPSDGGATLVDVRDGDRVALQPPPQGGFVIYAGARVRNLDPCGGFMKGQLRHPTTNALLSDFDKRYTDFEPRGDGWWQPRSLASFDTVSNIPVCPGLTGEGFVDREVVLEVEVTDRGGRQAVVTRRVMTVCEPGTCQPECNCICAPGYFAGKCGVDAGILPHDGGDSCGRQ